jgi:hypothetical protein
MPKMKVKEKRKRSKGRNMKKKMLEEIVATYH